jgi:2-oxo-4-hydroxy-4-carboxy--5-ureidoimidazoline (OHCU) decarboxylase
MTSLLPISTCLSGPNTESSPLAHALSVLFEPSPILSSTLVPQVTSRLSLLSPTNTVRSYHELIHVALETISDWDDNLKAQFIAGHPRIGECKNLSKLSATEQGATATTAPEVLARLKYLNDLYERKYPGLRYITFVNGRSRAVIADEMEGFLAIEQGPEKTTAADIEVEEVGRDAWKAELNRAICDVGRIANGRLEALGVQ